MLCDCLQALLFVFLFCLPLSLSVGLSELFEGLGGDMIVSLILSCTVS